MLCPTKFAATIAANTAGSSANAEYNAVPNTKHATRLDTEFKTVANAIPSTVVNPAIKRSGRIVSISVPGPNNPLYAPDIRLIAEITAGFDGPCGDVRTFRSRPSNERTTTSINTRTEKNCPNTRSLTPRANDAPRTAPKAVAIKYGEDRNRSTLRSFLKFRIAPTDPISAVSLLALMAAIGDNPENSNAASNTGPPLLPIPLRNPDAKAENINRV